LYAEILNEVLNMTPLAREIEKRGLKKGWIAEKAGISRSTLALIVSGRSEPTLKVALRIAKVLGMTVEELWGHLIEEKENRPDQ
jgi:DNA-binding XRE family transcriptional regulator